MKATATVLVELAFYRLRDVAVNLYESWELSRGEDAPLAVWQEFTEAFLRHYLPPELRRARVYRFLTLRQGNMSVREYNLQFDSLARYAPTILAKMEDWVHQFMMGLELHLLNDCMPVSLQPGIDISCIQPYTQGVEERSTLSYVTPLVASKFGIKPELIEPFEVSTPVGYPVIAKRIKYGSVPISREASSGVERKCCIAERWVYFLSQGKANVIADALSHRYMDSLSYLQPEKSEIAREIHQLANLGVRLLNSSGTGVTIQDTATSSLVTEVKERQYEDPLLAHYRDTTPQKEKTQFEITEDRFLRYRGRLCVPNMAGLCQQVMGEAHYSRYSIHLGATKMYHDIRGIYWWNGMEKYIAKFVAQCPNCQQVKIEH
ncbi:uncharacterized protein [Nicotiana tomentosiformis]|uniref:uncharacterized protein n=1 Tax=Nicotiana tomentosiformis TaxID=4098 RepID=UPI00388C426D